MTAVAHADDAHPPRPERLTPGTAGPLDPGLYVVSTPIGSARDITLRALDVLTAADTLLAEDTRVLRRLLEIHGVALNGREILAYHDHNGRRMRPRLLGLLADGQSLAYASDAGTPMVADPGHVLAREAIEAGHRVHAVPGASAPLAALTVSGLPTDRFHFAGFPPQAAGPRRRWLEELAQIPATLVLFEAPKRMTRILKECVAVMGGDRRAVMCRELTKKFEEIQRMPLAQLADASEAMVQKGECVLLIDRPDASSAVEEADILQALETALAEMSLRDAVQSVVDATGAPKRDVYQLGLGLKAAKGRP